MKWKEGKEKVFKTITRPAKAYCSECRTIKKKDESKLNSDETRIFRRARGMSRLDHIINDDIRKEVHIKPIVTFLENMILKWFGTA